MPPSVSTSAVFGALVDAVGEESARLWWKWLTVELPGWGRDGWKRVDAGRADACGN